MPLDDVTGRRYGPVPFSTSPAMCDRYVAATGDDPDRWRSNAPSALAGAMLFAVTPLLLGDSDLSEVTGSVIHGEQTFAWLRPIPLDSELSLTGEITRLRERAGVFFVGFDLDVSVDGDTVLTGSSLFLMSGGAPPAGDSLEEAEPDPLAGSLLEVAAATGAPAVGDGIEPLERSASRSDLIRYAGASQDFNPIHWDHAAAVGAGLPGVVVHGLLQSAWLCQAVERHGATLGTARFRFRAPLRPAATVTISGSRTAQGWEAKAFGDNGTEHVSAAFGDRT